MTNIAGVALHVRCSRSPRWEILRTACPEIDLTLSPGGITTMNATEVAQNNFNSWNRHDADAIVAAYAKRGTYRTPRMGQVLIGSAIGDFAKSVWAAFPDASLELISIGDTGGGLVAIQWILHGTHTGPLMDGTPPSGRKVSYPGLPSLRLRAKRFALSKFTLTGRR
jgi:SnoaL-like polyketide cyclase